MPTTLDFTPFQATRYAADPSEDLAALTSPPYDMLDPDAVAGLRAGHPHNIVRLTVPPDPRNAEPAGDLFRAWRSSGVLTTDADPGFYVYEQRAANAQVLQRGLLGALGLRKAEDRVVLPHESVLPGPVAGRLALLRACRANLEPLLLSYDGSGGPTRAIIADAAAGPPLVSASTADSIEHRVWRVDDPVRLAAITDDMRHRQALIGDGHHRYAAAMEYQALQDGAGPWDHVLALLVDQGAHPLEISAIHRLVPDISLDAFTHGAREILELGADQIFESYGSRPDPAEVAFGAAGGTRFLATDGTRAVLLTGPPSGEIDAALLDERLLHEHLGMTPEHVGYIHRWDDAVQRARHGEGVAVKLAPVDEKVVLDLALQGRTMPRKSTSFGPKPRVGLVMREL